MAKLLVSLRNADLIPRPRIPEFFGGGMSVQQIDKYVDCGIIVPVRIGVKIFFKPEDLMKLAESGKFGVLPSTDTPAKRLEREKKRNAGKRRKVARP